MTASRRQFMAPRELGLIQSAAGRILPLGLSRQLLAGPSGVGFGVSVGDVHNGMIVETANRTALAVGPTPVGTELEAPPVREITKVDWMVGRTEDERTSLQHVRERAGIVPWIR